MRLTTNELRLTLDGLAERAGRDHERDVALAWHIARLSRAKFMPALKGLLRRRRVTAAEVEAARQAHEEIEAELGDV